MLLCSLLCLLNVVFSACAAPSPSSPPVDIRLRAPWQAPPLLLEILEAAHTEDASSFWPLLEHLTESQSSRERLANGSAKDVYESAKEALDSRRLLQGAGSRSNWDMALALHSEGPKVAAFWQLANTSGVHAQWTKEVEEGKIDSHQCASWVDWYGRVACSPEDLDSLLNASDDMRVPSYPFDHKLERKGTPRAAPTAVLYARPLSPNFHALHRYLFDRATNAQGAFRYILRWAPDDSTTATTSGYLAGYGAALDLKKVDYLVIDDRKLTHASDAPAIDDNSQQSTIRQSQLAEREWLDAQLVTETQPHNSSEQLSSAELEAIAVKAAQAILQSTDPVRFMAQLTQDFPLHSANLARGSVIPPQELLDEIKFMQTRKIRPGAQDIWLNGRPLSAQDVVPLKLLKSLRTERALVNSLISGPLGLTPSQATDLLADGVIGKAQAPESENVVFFDASDRIERQHLLQTAQSRGEAVESLDEVQGPLTWLNDVEKDPVFQRLPRTLKGLLRPTYPGQFPQVARNLFNAVLVLDLSSKAACAFLADDLWPLIGRIPLRWGLVPGGLERGPDSDASKIARLFWSLLDRSGIETAIEFLAELSSNNKVTDDAIPVHVAQTQYEKLVKRLGGADYAESIANSPMLGRESAVREYVQRLRLTMDEDADGHLMLNGQYYPFMGRQVFQLIVQVVSIQAQQLARPVYFGQISDDDDISTYFYDLPTTFASRSELVFPRLDAQGEVTGPKPRAVDLAQFAKTLQSTQHGADKVLEQFLWPDAEGSVNATMWVAGDLDAPEGLQLIRQAVMALEKTPFRLGFVHAASDSSHTHLSSFLAQLISSEQLRGIAPEQLLEVLAEVNSQPAYNLVDTGKVIPDDATSQREYSAGTTPSYIDSAKVRGWHLPAELSADSLWRECQPLIDHLDLGRGEHALLVNGRLLSGISASNVTSDDIVTLLKNEKQRRIDPVVGGLDRLKEKTRLEELNREEAATGIGIVSSALSVNYFKDETQEGMFAPPVVTRTSVFDRLDIQKSQFEVGDRSTARLKFQAIVDPLSETAQKWSELFKLVTQMDDVYLSVVLNPRLNVSEIPLKRFYRYNAPSKLVFDEQSGKEVAPTISFLDMPQDAVLTMGLDAPPAWLTQASGAVYDLDNIRLRDVPSDGRQKGVVAVYDLKQILIEGHAREGRNEIPRGLQLVLETPDGSETLDTIVMANLAYFQFRARPGLYRLRIREGGKSDELYEMQSVGNLGWDSPTVDVTGNDITLASLDGLTIYPRVEKRPGKEMEELLEDLEGDAMLDGRDGKSTGVGGGGIASFLNNLAGKAKSATPSLRVRPEGQADINIFTVASGHLYERMTYIMILSVLKHTKSTVKFWFIENFLSPSFKELIPHFAKEYNFQYEMVTYAWPHWLRSQTEKQRTIWGYKILFLDVLFPLDIDKVIFVDSDQVVRTDLKELTEIDLHGAPYGFPPMGDDSYDMDGYRFWKRGYWKDFLRGRPYHISALYVVDLQRFRNVAAGDKLRGQYQALSQDPASLANLDQDLPQTLMFHLPIHTLDKEWLWCETWCSDEWLNKAKTIDLCSNPKTHEAKLDRARRQIPEWTVYDDEVQRFARRVQGGRVVEDDESGEPIRHTHSHDEL